MKFFLPFAVPLFYFSSVSTSSFLIRDHSPLLSLQLGIAAPTSFFLPPLFRGLESLSDFHETADVAMFNPSCKTRELLPFLRKVIGLFDLASIFPSLFQLLHLRHRRLFSLERQGDPPLSSTSFYAGFTPWRVRVPSRRTPFKIWLRPQHEALLFVNLSPRETLSSQSPLNPMPRRFLDIRFSLVCTCFPPNG